MSELEKAKLQEVSADSNETPVGDPVEVQFNPNSLKLTLKNAVEGGRARGRQRRQQTGTSSTTLSMDLIFDSADETEAAPGGPPRPVSVRKKTAMLEKYVVPKTDGSETPPRMRFEWKELILSGIVEGLDIDFELFAPDGTPLRAKTKLTIKEQDPKYQYLESGPGARDNAAANRRAATPGAGTNDAPPAPGGGDTAGASGERSIRALEGETPPELAARISLDPAAWRGLDLDLGGALSLTAGLEVGFSAGLSLSAGIGVSAGFSAGIDLSLEASLGLEVGAGTSLEPAAATGLSANTLAGLGLAGAGGVGAAIEQAKISKQDAAAGAARSAFKATDASTADGTQVLPTADASVLGSTAAAAGSAGTPAEQSHTPLSAEPARERISRPGAASAPRPPLSDPRANSYGAGLPLRPLIRTAAEQRQPTVFSDDLSTGATPIPGAGHAPWERLPRSDPGRAQADLAEQARRANPCASLFWRPGGRRP